MEAVIIAGRVYLPPLADYVIKDAREIHRHTLENRALPAITSGVQMKLGDYYAVS